MKRFWKTKATVVLFLLSASDAAAASYSYGPVIYPTSGSGIYQDVSGQPHSDYQTLDWSGVSLSIPKFDTSLGTLTSVGLEFEVVLAGSGGAENTGQGSATVTFTLAASLSLRRPDNSELITLTLSDSSYSKVCSSYDGIVDFEGDSGLTVDHYTVNEVKTSSFTSQSDLVLFSGSDSISLPVSALGQSGFSGSGNLVHSVSSGAKASVTVIYTYTPVPEPSVVGLVSGLGLVGFAGWRRTRQSRKPGC